VSFLTGFPLHAEPPRTQNSGLREKEANSYSASEVQTLIDELTESAKEEIERAASEAAKAAVMASLEREAAAIAEARRWQGLYQAEQKDSVKNLVLAGLVCFVVGAAGGVGAVVYSGR
jgi:predicted transcriptional regulator